MRQSKLLSKTTSGPRQWASLKSISNDVDIVVESTSVFYHNVPNYLLANYALNGTGGAYGWGDFRTEVLQALTKYYGHNYVAQRNKCIKVSAGGNRLNADVVPCVRYRQYLHSYDYVSGITFWTRDQNIQVINFPKLHLDNGSIKNVECNQNYKPNIRVFKNARNRANNDFPSYFLECMLYNVPQQKLVNSFVTTFDGILLHLCTSKNDGSMAGWKCQNGEQEIFGIGEHQIGLANAHKLVSDLVDLWTHWN